MRAARTLWFPRHLSKEQWAKEPSKQKVQQQQQRATGPLVVLTLRPMVQMDLYLVPVSPNLIPCNKTGWHFWIQFHSVLFCTLSLCCPPRLLEEAMALSSCSNGSLEPLDSDGLVAHNDQVFSFSSLMSRRGLNFCFLGATADG